jgi:hypothetical protein
MIIFCVKSKEGNRGRELGLAERKERPRGTKHRGIQIKDAAADWTGSSAALIVTVADC